MEKQTHHNLILLPLLLMCLGSVSACSPPKKLFVFGDSYVDTGNLPKVFTPWLQPYGITFPGKPAGRFSSGRVLTDFIASFLKIKSPVPYAMMKNATLSELRYGMNFAFGGTGVLDTTVPAPNMTTQIEFFEQLLEQKIFTRKDLHSSIALVSLAGNDYTTFLSKDPNPIQDLPAIIEKVTGQLAMNLERIKRLGVRKVAVTELEPVGCLPRMTAPVSHNKCVGSWNSAVKIHNNIIKQSVRKLNKEQNGNNKKSKSGFVMLDLFKAFLHVQKSKKFENFLKPCCVGLSSDSSCGDLDSNGVKQYTLCKEPESSFFWDNVHPTQAGAEPEIQYGVGQTQCKSNKLDIKILS